MEIDDRFDCLEHQAEGLLATIRMAREAEDVAQPKLPGLDADVAAAHLRDLGWVCVAPADQRAAGEPELTPAVCLKALHELHRRGVLTQTEASMVAKSIEHTQGTHPEWWGLKATAGATGRAG